MQLCEAVAWAEASAGRGAGNLPPATSLPGPPSCALPAWGGPVTRRPQSYPGACSMQGKVCRAAGGAQCGDARQRGRGRPTPLGRQRHFSTFPPTDNHLLTRLCTQEMATAPRGCFFLICPPRGSTFFCFPQRCHIGQQCASGQGCLKDEGMSPSGALTGLTVLTPMPCAHDHRSLGTLPFRLY